MSCSLDDLKEYYFGELDAAGRSRLEDHLGRCAACREELERLRLTRTALNSLREEEPPRRIAFVSDQVFAPNWWQRLWQSGPRLGFASAALLAAAIVTHGFAVRPAAVLPAAVAPDNAAIEARIGAEVGKRVEAAVAASEARQKKQTEDLLLAVQRRSELQREADHIALTEYINLQQKRENNLVLAGVR